MSALTAFIDSVLCCAWRATAWRLMPWIFYVSRLPTELQHQTLHEQKLTGRVDITSKWVQMKTRYLDDLPSPLSRLWHHLLFYSVCGGPEFHWMNATYRPQITQISCSRDMYHCAIFIAWKGWPIQLNLVWKILVLNILCPREGSPRRFRWIHQIQYDLFMVLWFESETA